MNVPAELHAIEEGPGEGSKLLQTALHRRWWIILPFLITLLAGLTYLLVAPRTYEAETLILIQRQKVPEDFVRTIVSSDVGDRLKTITQQVTSRTNLEKIIKQYNLFSEAGQILTVDEKVALFRKNISVETDQKPGQRQEAAAFTIKFQGKDPETVADVTNTIASNFITENLMLRESMALGTSDFLSDELKSITRKLSEKEKELKAYREKYMGGLPEQLDTNLRVLERLQSQLDQQSKGLIEAENRRILVQRELSDFEAASNSLQGAVLPGGQQGPKTLAGLQNELAELRTRYTEDHPDVIRLRKLIEDFGKRAPKAEAGEEQPKGVPSLAPLQTTQLLKRQLVETESSISGLKAESDKLKAQIHWYDAKVKETPKREQELLGLNRDYQNLKALYESLLQRKLEAEISVSMEKKQKGEQFRVIDSAKVPDKPVKPDVRKVALIILALGLGLGGALAYLVEAMDSSYKTPEEVERDLNAEVLVTMPLGHTKGELRRIKFKKTFAALSVSLGFALSVAGIVLATQGVDATVIYLKELLSKIYMTAGL
jgi:polysaccharide chain length determinant protein (PEP-CTERM system associated)